MSRLPSVCALVLALLLAAALPAYGAEVLVGAQPGVGGETLHATLEEAGYTCIRDLLHGSVHLVPLAEGETVKQACAAIDQLPGVRYCEANGTVRSQAVTPNDPHFGEQTYLQQIHAPTAWETTTGSRSVVVAVLDSGVDLDHPDLVANLDPNGINIPNPGQPPQDDDASQSHGTHIAGLIGAVGNNKIGIAGVNWQVDLLPVKVLSGDTGTVADVADGITAAVNAGAAVINASFGAHASQTNGKALCDAVNDAEQAGVIVVAAAGNMDPRLNIPAHDINSGRPQDAEYPASCPNANLLVVTAYDGGAFDDSLFNWGASSVDLAAPGTDLLSTGDPNLNVGAYHLLTGTSQSTALVSGAVALLFSSEPDLDPTDPTLTSAARALRVAQVRARVLAAVDVTPALQGRCATSGSLNLAKLFSTSGDTDGDGVPDASDNCPSTANADQADCDADSIGNACDNTPGCTSDGGGDGGCQAARAVAPGAAWPGAVLLLAPLVVAALLRRDGCHLPVDR